MLSSLAALAAVAVGFNAAVWGWNPYDTDSSRVQGSDIEPSSPGNYWAPAAPGRWADQSPQGTEELTGSWDRSSRWYLPEPAKTERWSGANDKDYGWDAYSAPRDWSERQRWEEGATWRERHDRAPRDPSPRHHEFQAPYEQGDYAAGPPPQWTNDAWRQRSLYDDFAQGRNQAPGREPASGGGRSNWGAGAFHAYKPARDQRESEPQEDRFNGYRFRHDPELTAQGSGRRNGWNFRPLTERDQERRRSPELYPRIDESDYVQRGPWRSYQDEGAAFGYHADDPDPSSGSYWGR